MPDGPYLTPEEESLMRMLAESGSAEGAGQGLLHRLEVLEAAVAALEAQQVSAEKPAVAGPEPSSGQEPTGKS